MTEDLVRLAKGSSGEATESAVDMVENGRNLLKSARPLVICNQVKWRAPNILTLEKFSDVSILTLKTGALSD